MAIVRNNYVLNLPHRQGNISKRQIKSARDWWLVKYDSKPHNRGIVRIGNTEIHLLPEYIGKRIKLKVVVMNNSKELSYERAHKKKYRQKNRFPIQRQLLFSFRFYQKDSLEESKK